MIEDWNVLEFEGQHVVYHITIPTDRRVCVVSDAGRQQVLGQDGQEQEFYLLDRWTVSSVRRDGAYELWLQPPAVQRQGISVAFEAGKADAAAEVWSPARGLLTHTCLGRKEWREIQELFITPDQAFRIRQDAH